jgi:integrase
MPKTSVVARYPHPKFPRLSVQLRSNSRFYQAVTFIDGKLAQWSTKTPDLPLALKLSEDWYRRQVRASATFGNAHPITRLTNDPTMAELFASYCAAQEPRRQAYARMRWSPIAHFWRARLLSTVGTDIFKEFFAWRRQHTGVKTITIHKDTCLIRKLLKHAIDQGMLTTLPRIPSVGTIEKNPRPWFTPSEWAHLTQMAVQRIETARGTRIRRQRQDTLDFVAFLGGSMLRVGELRSLRFHACQVETNQDGDKMLLCEVSGKRGVRRPVTNAVAAAIYERRLKGVQPTDLIFPHGCRNGFRELLKAAGLRDNAQGFRRNLKSVRATSISTALLNNPNLNLTVLARNSGTSVQMVDEFYAKRLTPEMFKHELSAMPAEMSAALKAAEAEAEGKRLLKKVEKLVLDGLSPEARQAMLERAVEEFVKNMKRTPTS